MKCFVFVWRTSMLDTTWCEYKFINYVSSHDDHFMFLKNFHVNLTGFWHSMLRHRASRNQLGDQPTWTVCKLTEEELDKHVLETLNILQNSAEKYLFIYYLLNSWWLASSFVIIRNIMLKIVRCTGIVLENMINSIISSSWKISCRCFTS